MTKPLLTMSSATISRFVSSHMDQRSQANIHILGLGSIGTLTAHSLSEIPDNPSVTLLLHRESLLDAYKAGGNQIKFETRDGKHVRSHGHKLEVLHDGKWYGSQDYEQMRTQQLSASPLSTEIENLIVCVKATQTVAALRPLKHRLTAKSSILFLQNGSGMVDEANEKLFPNPETRPNYLLGVISHGVTLNKPFDATHTGFSATSIGPVPRRGHKHPESSASNYLLQNLPLSPTLNTTAYSYTDVLQVQLEKLAVNAFCNPLCALHDAQNKFLFTLPEIRQKLMAEISTVVQNLPELQDISAIKIKERFDPHQLESTVNAIIKKTAETTCSMVWDLRAGRETEIRYINGFWCRKGNEVGVPTPINDSLVEQILARRT
ncbi:ketopantoate reductase [Lipomyces kononenkoae]